MSSNLLVLRIMANMSENSGMKRITVTDETTPIYTVTLYCTLDKVTAVAQTYITGTLVAAAATATDVDVCVTVCRSRSTNCVWRESDGYAAHMVH
jgi:hypothetical protein